MGLLVQIAAIGRTFFLCGQNIDFSQCFPQFLRSGSDQDVSKIGSGLNQD
jgi:hypothetical protein